MKRLLLTYLFLLFSSFIYSQVGINTNSPDPSSALDIQSTNGGILIPRLTQDQRDAIAYPATGLLIFQTNESAGFYFYNGEQWTRIEGAGFEQSSEAAAEGITEVIAGYGLSGGGNTGQVTLDIDFTTFSTVMPGLTDYVVGFDQTGESLIRISDILALAPEGNPGPAGPQGEQGEQGVRGDDGIDGAQGPAGPTGPQGLEGEQGIQGPQGEQGPAGPAGPTGPQGPQGVAGTNGTNGIDGEQGPAGPAGPQGVAGTEGNDGTNGLSAYETWLNLGNSGTEQDFIDSLTGPQGSNSLDSPTILEISDYSICSEVDCVNNLLSNNWKLLGGVSIDESRGGTGGNAHSRTWKQALVYSIDFESNQIEDYVVALNESDIFDLISQGYQPYGKISYGESRGGTGGSNYSSSIAQAMVKFYSGNSASLGFGNTIYFNNQNQTNLNNFDGDYLLSHGVYIVNNGQSDSWTVPVGVYEIQIIQFGTDGGKSGQWCAGAPPNGCYGGSEGIGGYGMDVSFKIDVSPGDVLTILVGENGVNQDDGYRNAQPNVGGDGGLSQIFINDELLLYSVGGTGGTRGNGPCSNCAPGDGDQGSHGTVYFYGNSETGYSAYSVFNTYNYGLIPLGLKDLNVDLNITDRNFSNMTATVIISY